MDDGLRNDGQETQMVRGLTEHDRSWWSRVHG